MRANFRQKFTKVESNLHNYKCIVMCFFHLLFCVCFCPVSTVYEMITPIVLYVNRFLRPKNPMYANRSLLVEQQTNRAAVAQVHAIDAIPQKNRFMHCFDKFNGFSVSFSSKHEPDEVSYKHIRIAGCAWHVNSSWMK